MSYASAYFDAISAQLGPGEEATVVMTTAKDDPGSWAVWDRDRNEEQALRDRFLDPADPLRFLIVTAKLLTGFDAPVEGVMYLDKPLRAHTLFQAVTRTNRRWTNPGPARRSCTGSSSTTWVWEPSWRRLSRSRTPGVGRLWPVDVEALFVVLAELVGQTLAPFAGVDRTADAYEQMMAAQERLATIDARADFAERFLRCEALFELLWPDTRLRPIEDDYRWLARIYASVTPTADANALLWHRLGEKTRDLIGSYISDVGIGDAASEAIAIDADTFEVLRQLELFGPDGFRAGTTPTVDEVLDTVEARLRRKLSGPATHPVWRALSVRLEELRQARVTGAKGSVEFLKSLLELARQVVGAERAEADGRLDSFEVLDPDRGALTQILEEYAPPGVPVIVANVVEQVDAIVKPIRGTRWQESQPGDREVRRQLRLVLKNSGLPPSGELYDRAYGYIREHY